MTVGGAARPSNVSIRIRDVGRGYVLDQLSRVDVLRALPPEEVQMLVDNVERVSFPPGTHITEEGRSGDALYFIQDGEATVMRGGAVIAHVGPGTVIGETALMTGAARNATITAEKNVRAWRVSKQAFEQIVSGSPRFREALERVIDERKPGATPVRLPSREYWIATALRALEARSRGAQAWQWAMGVGVLLWFALLLNEKLDFFPTENIQVWIAVTQLITGMLIIGGACEAFLHGVDRLGARLHWDGFISGTIASILATLPEFVVILFLVRIEPLAAFVTTVVTIFNNALAFSVYSFFLPKDRAGAFAMPRSLTAAGGEILIAGGATALIVGLVMLVLKLEGQVVALQRFDLIGIGVVLMATYVYYIVTLVQYYGEGKDDRESVPPDPHILGHDISKRGIVFLFALGMFGAYAGGESVGAFAETALNRLQLPTIPTAAALAFFAGISEYIIVYKAHRRGELSVALSNVFGGMTQVMFLLLPFGMITIGLMGVLGMGAQFVIPINTVTLLLMLLLFPLFYALHQYVEQEKSLTNLDAFAMTGIYLLLLYFLFTSPT